MEEYKTGNASLFATAARAQPMKMMKILKRYIDEDKWMEVTQQECLDRTEGAGYWKPNSVLSMLADGLIVRTPWAVYKREGAPC